MMKLALMLAASSLWAQQSAYTIDTLHSAAHFSVRHMMITTVRGQFGGVKGAVRFDPKNPAATTIEATIDCSTINSGEPKRDADLKGEEFFDVKKYPVMKFKSNKVEAAGAGRLKVTGELTINATTRQVVLDVDGPTPPVKDTRGREKVGASATTKISRKDFGITWNQVLEAGGVAVSDEVSITIDLELIKTP
ncbi:MAG: YceI family protein [Bryobacteraceae bacterium]|nr:YceI family protein [Bryobacteraceae bacterium]